MANRSDRPPAARRNGRRLTRRDELLGIAADLFAEHGFAGVTVDDLGAAAGVSGPALYHHFDSKEALLGEMLVRISESLLAQGEMIVERDPPGDRLNALITMHVDFAVDQRALITVHFRDLVHASEADELRVHELQRAYVDIWVDAVLHHRPSMGRRMARASVHAAFGLINSTPFSGRLRRDDMVALLCTMADGALRALDVSELREH
ncbi:MAG: TetR family transcriptional regulator [Ilumatobacteraceae bacterium]|nr:TetR family transcriptional regulator [Ilumatobacteraceae bacterium]